MRNLLRTAALATTLFAAVPALAQDANQPVLAQDQDRPVLPLPASQLPNEDDGSDFAAVGLALALLPDYEGSDDYGVTPAPGAVGRISGFNFLVAGNRASVDLIPDGVGATYDVQAGPIGVVNFNRNSVRNIDARVAALGERDTAIELGGYVGFGKTGVITSNFDRLSATISYRKGVTGAHSAGLLVPTVTYATPLSLKTLASVFVSAERAERGYADAYFGVSPAGSIASGLPVFNARGGWKNWTLGGVAATSLTGDLRGGLQLVGGVVYRRMLNDFGDSPVTSIAGSRSQWLGAIGLGYSF